MSNRYVPRRSLRIGLALGLATSLATSLGCASVRVRSPESGSATRAEAQTDGADQSLYRLTYDSGEGRTSLKVVLRRSAGQRFQVVFSDLAGRRVWGLDHSSQRTVLVDHRAGTFCVSGPELTLPDVHPQELPLAAIPRVLAGKLPIDDPLAEGRDDFVDDSGRRWRVSREGEQLVAWSLLDASGPALWWARARDGGILSRRGGEQYRWS